MPPGPDAPPLVAEGEDANSGRVRPSLPAGLPVGPVAVVAVLVAFTWWLGEAYRDEPEWLDVAVRATMLAVAGVGLNVLVGYTGLLSLGHAAFFVAGGFFGAVLAPRWGLDPWFGFPVAFLAGAALGALLALMCCHLRGLYLTVVTLAFAALVPALFSALGQPNGERVTELLDADGLLTARGDYRVGLLWVGTALLLVALFLARNVRRSRWGRAYAAIRESERAAAASGVRTYWYKVSAFAVSAGIVATAGVVGAQVLLNVSPGGARQTASFAYVTVVVLGGMGTLLGPVVGAFAVEFGLAVDWVQETFRDELGLFFGVVVLAVVGLAPEGLAGLAARVRRAAVLRRPALDRPPPVPPPPAGSGSALGGVLVGRATAATAAASAAGGRGAVLEVRDLTKRFGGLAALVHFDVEVMAGTVHGVIGPNGSGKSTLVDVVSGAQRPTAGQVLLRGEDVTDLGAPARARLGVARTFQNLQVWRRMTVLENVMVGAHTRTRVDLARSLAGTWASRREERAVAERAWALLHAVGLAPRGHDLAGALPFADLRHLEIARALAGEPDLLLLDEPAAGLHPGELGGLVELIGHVRAAGVTVVLVEHHVEVVMSLSDRVSVLDYGEKIAEGTPAQVRRDQRVVEAYLGTEEP